MQVIPVLDLLKSQVVHAVRGDRANYRPLRSDLTTATTAREVCAALLTLHPFRKIYIADLDAIRGQGSCHHEICLLTAQYPDLEIWLDAGFATRTDLEPYAACPRITFVLGTESQHSFASYEALRATLAPTRCVLSLDRRGAALLGPPEIFERPASWPATVVAMNLAYVGAGDGPDWQTLEETRLRAGARRIAAAGGLRDIVDARALAAAGIDFALVATALHDGRLGAGDLLELESVRASGRG
ncbi:MAG: hypothetical protein HY749_21495 [Gammaproteobacteria bacterium]|nr:hypothetical protein [Gammaproteobacteria bacterium]MBI5618865.1 hypothetical protein [Gammaproteobacteria bacterium]